VKYRQLGSAGVRLSAIGLGTNRFGSDRVPLRAVRSIVDAALDAGINHIDTADVYQGGRSEETLGVALQGRWDQVVLATKFWFPVGDGPNDRGASRYHMTYALEASLQRLQTDHIDLYYVHRWDNDTPIEETLRALDDLVRSGKVRYVGASEFAAWQLAHANLLAEVRAWTPFTVVQSHYHLLERTVEGSVLPFCEARRVGFIPYYPLAGGFLTGKYRQDEPPPAGSRGESSEYVQGYMTDANYRRIHTLQRWAEARGRGLDELAQAWLLGHPQVCSVISGATTAEHVVRNARAASWDLTADEMDEIEAILER
jgi:aryl-alcohol dehydrogenase-like predicted oxidoreductase